jgi:hypothetical protein
MADITERLPFGELDDAVMPFGRYAGMLLYELMFTDMPYVTWLLQQPWLDAGVAASLKAAVAEYRADRAAEAAEEDAA